MNRKPGRVSFALITILFLSSSLLFSCLSVSKFVSKANMNTAMVPHDYNPQKHVILFAEMPRLNNPKERNSHVTKKLEEALREYFPYKYEIVSLDDIYDKNSKYDDTSVYKFAMLNTLNSVRHGHTYTTTTKSPYSGTQVSSVSPSARTTYIDFGFYDRVTEKKYYNSFNPSPNLKYTIAALAEIIKRSLK